MPTAMTGPAAVGPNLDICTDDQQFPLGTVIDGPQGKRYRYVQFQDAITYVAGHVVCRGAAETDYKVTNDANLMNAGLAPEGVVFQSTPPTENQYGWIQIAGVATVLIGSAAVIAGDWLKVDGTTDGAADEATPGTDEALVGYALATIADTATGLVQLTIRGA